jgi:signal transduction histidine kinase
MAHHQRLEMIGTLASGIAHEFNNLLTPIMGYSMLTLEQLPADREDLYDNILEIYNTSRKAREITSQLSQYVRKAGNEKKEYLSPEQLLTKVLHVSMPACPENVRVQKQVDCGGMQIYGNETQLSQLLLNLMINGFHAMAEHGGTLTVSGTVQKDKVIITVQDTGCGIPESVLPHVFEPFFTTKEGGQGTGLGLAIAQQIIEEHQGYIEVLSKEGEGSRFHVYLPAYRTRPGEKP